jgi:diguanylate cyclase (GGDEF)-like protein
MRAPIPTNERQRLEALEALAVGSSERDDDHPGGRHDERLSEIVGLAAELCHAPMAGVSIVDGDRQWFLSHRGMPEHSTERGRSFCAHAILSDQVLVVNDARIDARLFDSPLVVDDGIRFYAGAPLISAEGCAIGTLCVADRTPRTIEPWQEKMLQILARQAMAQLRLSQLVDEHEEALDDLDMAQRNLSFLATHDPLTGVLNRRAVTDLIDGLATANATGSVSSALLFIDLDHFKDVNDAYGHDAGDRVLVTIADRIHLGARGDDAVARLASDEFVVVIPNASTFAPESLAQRLNRAISVPVEHQGRAINVTASIGIARWGDQVLSAGDLLRDASAAMNYAKLEGRNRVVTFEDRVATELTRRLDKHSFVRHVVREGALRLDFQPLWSLSSGQVIAHEALLRWDSPGAPVITPAEFVATAEEIGLVGEITRFTIREACRLAARRRAAGELRATVTVNLSSIQLERDEVILEVASALNDHGLEPSALVLELTESAKLADSGPGQATLRELQNMGVRIALDDFGTGFASLALLRSFPFDYMKIDRSFVTVQSAADRDVLRSLVQLGHSLGMMVIAEGIEEPAVLEQLRELGCDVAQGYLLGRPAPADTPSHAGPHPLIAGLGTPG